MIKKAIAGLLLASSLTGCMGHNALTAKALKFNLSATEGRWGREGLFFGMFIIPVYPIFKLLDLLLFNSIEFWSGSNPLNGRSPLVDIPKSDLHKLGLDNVEIAQVERLDEHRANLYVEFENGDRVTFDVLRDRDTYTISWGGVEFFKASLKL
jgi:Domain of unknown function (DUF3332)